MDAASSDSGFVPDFRAVRKVRAFALATLNPQGGSHVKRLLAVLVAAVFAVGAVELAVAQEKKATTDDKKTTTDDKMKMAAKTAAGTVKSASGDSVVVAGKRQGKDAEWTFAVDAKTKVKKAGKDVAANELKAGDPVSVRYMEHEGKAIAQTITVTPKKTQ
jgi:hypothetical protein